jgi:hypothetical protein
LEVDLPTTDLVLPGFEGLALTLEEEPLELLLELTFEGLELVLG